MNPITHKRQQFSRAFIKTVVECFRLIIIISLILPQIPLNTVKANSYAKNGPVFTIKKPYFTERATTENNDTIGTITSRDDTGLLFIENVGQFEADVAYQVWGGEEVLWLTEDEIWMTVVDDFLYEGVDGKVTNNRVKAKLAANKLDGINLKLTFKGAKKNLRPIPFNRLETSVNYFYGQDPKNWHTNVPVWGGVRYEGLYPGIDLEITSKAGRLVHRLITHKGTDLSVVSLQIEGAISTLKDNKSINIKTPLGETKLPLLEVSTITDLYHPQYGMDDFSFNTQLAGNFQEIVQAPKSSYGSELGYSTLLGGSSSDTAMDIDVDSSGSAYITGYTYSADFPVSSGVFDTGYNGNWDAYIVKLNPEGTDLSYATFFGGSEIDNGIDIDVDASGSAYVTGHTVSPDFPITEGAYDTDLNGGQDAYVIKLNPEGTDITYATYLGGVNSDSGWGIATDQSGSAYITGRGGDGYPTTAGSFDTSYNSGDYDAFITKINPEGSSLLYSSFIGGLDLDHGYNVDIDSTGSAFVTGYSQSSDFPTSTSAYDTTPNGGIDAFILKVNPDGSTLAYSTFLGGANNDLGLDLVINPIGEAFITGRTFSTDFPITLLAFDTDLSGTQDAFITKLNNEGSELSYSTYLGGSDFDEGYGIAINDNNDVYVTGEVRSTDFPVTVGSLDTSFNGGQDGFLVVLSENGSTLYYGTYLGGSAQEYNNRVAQVNNETVFIAGETTSADFPTSVGAYDTLISEGGSDAFVVKLTFLAPSAFGKINPIDTTSDISLNPSLSWEASSNTDSYEYCFDTSDDDACETWISTGPSNSVDLIGLLPSTSYYWQVRAINDFSTTYANGSEASFWTFRTGDPPAGFGKLSPSDDAINQSTSPTLNWGASDAVTSYKYCIDTTDDDTCSAWVDNGTETSVALSELMLNTTYYWQVKAINNFGESYADGGDTAHWSFTTGNIPETFNKLTPIDETLGLSLAPTLSWSASTGAISYQYCYDTTDDGDCIGWNDNGTETSVTLSGLAENAVYYWQVKAINDFGTAYADGSLTDFSSFTTGYLPSLFLKTNPIDEAIDVTVSISHRIREAKERAVDNLA